MKVAVVGCRHLIVKHLEDYLPANVTEIVSGGARGIDSCAEYFARTHGLPLTVFYPDYDRYGKGAPLRRNNLIVQYADMVLAFWDGVSRGTAYTLRVCQNAGKPYKIFLVQADGTYKEQT